MGSSVLNHCPGASSFVRPQIVTRDCPSCGEEVEFFDYETQQDCSECGRTVYREASEICIKWCSYADKCINDLEGKGIMEKERADDLRKIWEKTRKET